MARKSKTEIIALAEEAQAGRSDIWQKVIDDAKAGVGRALEYLRSCVDPEPEPEPEPEPPFKGWRCERCGKRLPKSGLVWRHRYNNWKGRGKETSGLYCDPCGRRREMGFDEYQFLTSWR